MTSDRSRNEPGPHNEPGPRNEAGPREGIYLDAALSVVEQQVNERIDRVSHRRRITTRALITGLLITTLGGGVATAAALTIVPADSQPTTVVSSIELHCAEGASTRTPALFTARFSVQGSPESAIDFAAVCSDAREAVLNDNSGALQDATPDNLLAIAEAVIESSTESNSRGLVDVAEASFGPARGAAGPTDFTTCERSRDGRLTVLITPRESGSNTVAAQATRCLANDGYVLYEGTP